MNKNNLIQGTISLLWGLAIALFWALVHPELLSWHEQNQMFLFTGDYFSERISVAGGLADYISEFLTQFYLYPTLGAFILAIVFVALQQLLYAASKVICADLQRDWTLFALSFLPVTYLWGVMGDINMLLSFPVALLLSLATFLLARPLGWLGQLTLSLALYWLAGPAFAVQVILAMIAELSGTKSWLTKGLRAAILLIVAIAWVWICRTLWVAQYPWNTVLAGINYHRITLMTLQAPAGVYVVMALMALLPIITRLFSWFCQTFRNRALADGVFASILSLCLMGTSLYLCTSKACFDPNSYTMLQQMLLLRKSDWRGIIEHAHANQQTAYINTPLSCNAVNLALAKTQQMSVHMFEVPQHGIQGLIMPPVRDNVSNVASMEVFWQLGFVNESMRYAFDSQESIPNCRKSARFMQRLAECNIINGRYDVASKYIDFLKQTYFYCDWARQAEQYLYNEERIAQYPEWAQKREMRLENDFLYSYSEMDKMLGQLVLRNSDNQLAYDYFMAALLLEGDYRSFVANLPQQPQPGQSPFPHGYEEYVQRMQQRYGSTQPHVDATTGATSGNR